MANMNRKNKGSLSLVAIWISATVCAFSVGILTGYLVGKNVGESSGLVRGISQGAISERLQAAARERQQQKIVPPSTVTSDKEQEVSETP